MWFVVPFWIVASIFIFFQGFYAYEVHAIGKSTKRLHRYNQIWLNGLGSFIGWSFLFYFLHYRLKLPLYKADFNLSDLVLIFVSYIGVTGYLPHLVIDKQLISIGK